MTQCPLCKSNELTLHLDDPQDREYFVSRNVTAAFYRCQNCGSLIQTPWPSAEEAGSFYHSNYQNYEKTKAPFIGELFLWLQKRNVEHFLNKVGRDSTILDFGCNQGQFLNLLYDSGCQSLYGYDVVPLDKTDSVFTFTSDLDELINKKVKFDIIRMNHVIEHLPDLHKTMKQLAELLKPGGKIIGQTPNGGHYTANLFGGFWGPLHYPYHLALFSRKGFIEASQDWEMTLTQFSPTILPTGWAMSFENLMKTRTYKEVSGRTPVYIFYILLSIPFVFFDRLFASMLSAPIVDFELTKKEV